MELQINTTASHGDEYKGELIANFSSNVWLEGNYEGLYAHLHSKISLIHRYPEEHNTQLKSDLGAWLNINPENLLLTNGSIEGIYLIAQAYRNNKSLILQPTFSEYEKACKINEHEIIFCANHDLEDNIDKHQPNLVWICSPNNPDGYSFELSFLENIVEKYSKTIFIFDISFKEYCLEKQPNIDTINKYSNTILVYSFTKRYGIPGLRMGYIHSNSSIISILSKYCIPWALNTFAVEALKYITSNLNDQFDIYEWLQRKEKLIKSINELDAFECMDSTTPFFLVRLKKGKSADLKHFLLNKGILIRDASGFFSNNNQYIRLLTLSNDKNQLLINELYKWTQQSAV
jgi:threonine-phosphate decarboxylase